MANVTLPSALARKITAREINQSWPAQFNDSNWTGGGKILLLAGIEKHRFKCTFRPLATEDEIREARAFFYALRGIANTFELPYLPTPQGVTNTTVIAGGTVGTRVVEVASAAVLSPGMPFSVTLPSGHKRLFVLISKSANILTVEPAFSETPTLGATVQIANPVCRVRLADPSFTYSDEMGRAGFSFDVVEAIEAIDTGEEGTPAPPPLPEGGLQIYDEGLLQGDALSMNFVGDGVSVEVIGSVAIVTIDGLAAAGALLIANNLSDLADAAAARGNLGLGLAALLSLSEIDERARDALGAALVPGANILITPSDVGETITITATPPFLIIEPVAGTTYQFATADHYKHKRFTSAGSITATVPKNATDPIPVGTRIRITQAGTGQITLAPEDGTVILNSADNAYKSRVRYSVLEIEKVATNEWDVLGDVVV